MTDQDIARRNLTMTWMQGQRLSGAFNGRTMESKRAMSASIMQAMGKARDAGTLPVPFDRTTLADCVDCLCLLAS